VFHLNICVALVGHRRFGLVLKIRPIKTAIVHRRMGRGGHGSGKKQCKIRAKLKNFGKILICPEKMFVFSRKLRDVRVNFVICQENFFWYVRKKILVTSPSPRSPTILGENIV
jgi:hypothetical protein